MDSDSDDGFSLLATFRKAKGLPPKRRGEERPSSTTSQTKQSSQDSEGKGIREIKQGKSMEFTDDEKDTTNENKRHSQRKKRYSNEQVVDSPALSSPDPNDTTAHKKHSSSESKEQVSSSQESRRVKHSKDQISSIRKYPSSDDDSDSDDYFSRRKVSRPVTKKHKDKQHRRPSASYSSEDSSDSDDNRYSNVSNSRHSRKRVAKNPWAIEQEERAQVLKMAQKKKLESPVGKKAYDDDDDGFLSDCDPPSPEETKKRRKKVSEETKKYKKKRESSPTAEDSVAKRKKESKAEDNSSDDDDNSDNGYQSILGANDDGNNVGIDELHPTFTDPKFPPDDPMVPLLLSDAEGNQQAVPASLNRYLAPFQKEGVEFMYNCLTRKSGVILGDEMVRIQFQTAEANSTSFVLSCF